MSPAPFAQGMWRTASGPWRLLAIAASMLALAGCFGGHGNERDGESFWDEEPKAEDRPAAPPVPEYVVVRGDTLYMIAFRHGVDWRELASWNRIEAPYRIYPEQHLKLGPEPAPGSVVASAATTGANDARADAPDRAPETIASDATNAPEGAGAATFAVRDSAPAQAAPPQPASAPLSSVPSAPAATARTEPAHGKASAEPSAENEGSLTRAMRGAAPAKNGTEKPDAAAAKSESGPAKSEAAAPPAKPEPAKAETTAPVAKSESPATAGKTETAASPAKSTQIASAAPATSAAAPIAPGPVRNVGGSNWRWPAQGTLVGRFLPGDPARQGINVQGKPGGTVSAAADGEVVYSGNGLVGYGELIIVKHDGELLSAYGGSGKRLVAEGTRVRSGQPLAELAGNGIVHFEIRRSGKPVDPLEYLPSR